MQYGIPETNILRHDAVGSPTPLGLVADLVGSQTRHDSHYLGLPRLSIIGEPLSIHGLYAPIQTGYGLNIPVNRNVHVIDVVANIDDPSLTYELDSDIVDNFDNVVQFEAWAGGLYWEAPIATEWIGPRQITCFYEHAIDYMNPWRILSDPTKIRVQNGFFALPQFGLSHAE